MTLQRFLVAISVCVLLLACSSGKKPNVKYQKRFDFQSVTSYSLFPRDSKFSDYQNVSDALRNSVELAIERELDNKGFSYQNLEQADIIIGYYIVDQSQNNFIRYNKGVNFCEYCLKSYSSDLGRQTLVVKPGSLVLDMVDPVTKRSVWRSVYPLKVKFEDNSREVQEKIRAAVAIMLEHYSTITTNSAFEFKHTVELGRV